MKYYAVQRTHGCCGVQDDLFVFDTKRERDFFLKHGERYSYMLVVPWETFPVKASEARAYAKVDDFGDRYAYRYEGGVEYVWGNAGYDKWWDEHDGRSAA